MRLDIIFNFIASVSLAVLTLVFTPVYVHFLGVEAYGLIGLLAVLQASLGLLDLGLSQVLARELARYFGGAITEQSARTLIRSVEILSLTLASLAALAIALPSEWIAGSWLQPGQVPVTGLVESIRIMSVIIALRLLEGLYRGAIIGIHRQFALNVITVFCAAARAFGSLAVFLFVSRAIQDFFLWQAIVSLINVGLLVALLYSSFPTSGLRTSFSLQELRRILRFAAGVTAASLLSIALTQTDKFLLSKLLLLREFGEYTLAATLAAAPHIFAAPITQAAQPRFVRAVAQSDVATLSLVFHSSAQLVTVTVGSAAVAVIVFSEDILALWLQNAELAARLAPLVSALAIGSLLNGFTWLPFSLQLAHGWTSLTVRTNLVAVAMLVPALFIVVPVYGAIGAAWLWVLLNLGFFTITVQIMFGRILPNHKVRWYLVDIAMPLLAAATVAVLAKLALPTDGLIWQRLIGLVLTATAMVAGAALVAPLVKTEGLELLVQCRRFVSGRVDLWRTNRKRR